MNGEEQHEIPFEERRYRNQKLRRRGIFLIPSLFTVANLLCGYYAVVAAVVAASEMLNNLPKAGENLDHAAKAIGFAILFDSLDGRLARLLALLMALQAGLPPLDFGPLTGMGKHAYIASIHAAMGGNYEPLTAIFGRVIERSRRHAASNRR